MMRRELDVQQVQRKSQSHHQKVWRRAVSAVFIEH